MSKPAFLDTSAIFVLAMPREADHGSARNVFADPARMFILDELILIESFSLIAKRRGKPLAVEFVGALRSSLKIEAVPLTPDLLEAGWRRCLHYADKEWDWIDYISFELMHRRGLTEALSLDRHFAQAGFTLLVQ